MIAASTPTATATGRRRRQSSGAASATAVSAAPRGPESPSSIAPAASTAAATADPRRRPGRRCCGAAGDPRARPASDGAAIAGEVGAADAPGELVGARRRSAFVPEHPQHPPHVGERRTGRAGDDREPLARGVAVARAQHLRQGVGVVGDRLQAGRDGGLEVRGDPLTLLVRRLACVAFAVAAPPGDSVGQLAPQQALPARPAPDEQRARDRDERQQRLAGAPGRPGRTRPGSQPPPPRDPQRRRRPTRRSIGARRRRGRGRAPRCVVTDAPTRNPPSAACTSSTSATPASARSGARRLHASGSVIAGTASALTSRPPSSPAAPSSTSSSPATVSTAADSTSRRVDTPPP